MTATQLDDAEPPTVDPLEITLSAVDRVNFASAQNDVSILKKVALQNNTDQPVRDLTVVLRAEPPVIREKTWVIDRIGAGACMPLTDLSATLDLNILNGLDETEIGELIFTLTAPDADPFELRHRIELLARDEWGGVGDMAQLLAAYVSPNHPFVARILKDASKLLEQAGHSGALDGYQSNDPGKVWLIAGAIWSAATGLGLSYVMPPASFEQQGQKVRGASRIRAEGLATCLDTTLLLAAAFEAAGLNPAVLFSHGHAWVGVWLVSRDFGHVTEPDVITVRKASQAREFVPMETTLLTKRPAIGFTQAVDEGRRRLSEDRETEFVMAVDITRARAARIRPLASHSTNDEVSAADDPTVAAALPQPLDLGMLPGEMREEVPETPQGRIERWQRKLLDLSLRNRLLNFRETKQTLPFICPDISALEDALADGQSFQALALRENDPTAQRDLSLEDRRRIEEEVALNASGRGQIAVPLTEKDMNNRLLALYRKAKSDMQEGGTNTLFLAVGYLRWKKTEGDTRSYRAPLLLIPVKLERRSAQSAFKILHHEDDVRMNATLLEFLKRDFDLRVPELEGDLPMDHSGVDVPLILQIMRDRVRDVAGFEVVEELALSTFSFAKFLMWKDLVDRTDDLRKNKLVRHLVDSPSETFMSETERAVEPVDLDRRMAPKDLITPLPADSSQLAAVVAAAAGQDFVLIGPPGTGKSQTIANIIAQCLAHGKSILFVAEKAAALDVVHRRLAAHGLGEACLELHSNKTDRKSVLNQLGKSWDRYAGSDAAQWINITDKLQLRRDQLNDYVAALHAKGTQGFSVFDAIGQVAGRAPAFSVSFSSKDAHDETSYQALVGLADEVQRTFAVAGDGAALPLISATDWSFAWQGDLLKAADILAHSAHALDQVSGVLSTRLGLASDPDGVIQRHEMLSGLIARVASNAVSVADVPELSPSVLAENRAALALSLATREGALSGMSATYDAAAIDRMPLDTMEADWRSAQTKVWPMSKLALRKVRLLLQTYVENGAAVPDQDIKSLIDLRGCLTEISANPLAELAGGDLETLDNVLSQANAFREVVAALVPHVTDPQLFGQAKAALSGVDGGELAGLITRFADVKSRFDQHKQAFVDIAGKTQIEFTLKELQTQLSILKDNQARISDWTRWVEAREAALGRGLGAVITALEQGSFTGDAAGAFSQAYAAWWLPLAMDANDNLRRFAHWDHQDAINSFRKLEDEAAKHASDEVMRRIAHGLPSRDGVPKKSELGSLRHQLGLQRPSMPIRTLLSQMPTTFTKLAPCVLMSPLSVAQYLPAGQETFDVVIFDEASQITTWDAIGAIARARQSIIVGDPKQLPPTNFFGRADGGDEDLPEIEKDMPSILDEVSVAGIPARRLNWHYRSKDEALIAFSNHHYYDGGLVTFPAPSTGSDAIRFHRVDGTYARGHGRTNTDEARAIVTLVHQRLTGWLDLPEDERLTLGVITFNGEQQSLILDLLDQVRRKDPRLEWFFDDAREEPVIVKNLENIQGDERDIMLFSITFGPDMAGKLTMNFGALNSDGGEKRLNVAVTRARRELHVFASVSADQIDLTRTRALGVRHLKAFLDYAERGAVALAAQDEGSLGPADNMFEQSIADALAAKGWEVRTQIGVSGFRIDLGVINPDVAGAYLAGVECDGAQYHSSATARDRDKIRQAVLEGLGWNILRIWSTDWFRNAGDVLDRTHAELEVLLKQDRARRTREAEERKAETAVPAPTLLITGPEVDVIDDNPKEAEPAPFENPRFVLAASNSADNTTNKSDLERFFDDDYTPVLRRMLADLIAQDGPIALNSLAKTVAQRHGWQRTGARIATRVEEQLGAVDIRAEFGNRFIWEAGSYADRIPFRGLASRSIRDVSRTEIATVIDSNLKTFAATDDPTMALARQLGIARLSQDARDYLEKCWGWRDRTAV